MKLNKKIILLIGVISSMLILSACSKGNENVEVAKDKNSLEGIKEKGKLIVGTSADYPPYEFTILEDGKEKVVGFDMALAAYVAEELGVELEIMDMDFKNLVSSVKSGKVDMVLAGMSPDPVRAKSINFSQVYYNADHGVIVRKEDQGKYKSLEDLKGKSLGAQMGSVQEEIANDIEGAKVKGLALTNNLLMELKAGKIDAIIMEKPVSESYAKANTDIVLLDSIEIKSEEGGSAIAMKKDNKTLTDEVNKILDKVEKEKLIDKWFIEAQEAQESLSK